MFEDSFNLIIEILIIDSYDYEDVRCPRLSQFQSHN